MAIQKEKISFPNNTSIEILKEHGLFCGIGSVVHNNIQLRNDRLPILPYLETPDGFVASEFT